MTWFCVDVEANGPAPGLYSMTSLGVVAVRPELVDTFYAELQPLPDAGCDDDALAVGGMSMEYLRQHGRPVTEAMTELADWVSDTSSGRPVLVSDNNGFDAAFVAYYFALVAIPNPFGHSSRRIGDLYAGLQGDAAKGSSWKRLRRTAHTHNALDDAIGNAEALLAISREGLQIPTT
jgi:DNA polymerase III epsilon subunit-like protein